MAGNRNRHRDEEMVPMEEIFVWDDIVGHNAETHEVDVLVNPRKPGEPARVARLNMDSFQHSTALSRILEYLEIEYMAVTDPESDDAKHLHFWIDSLKYSIALAIEKEDDTLKELKLSEDNQQPDNFSFCCAVCKCPDERKSTFIISSGDDAVWHRFCCHDLTSCTTHWKSPTDLLLDKLAKAGMVNETKPLPQYKVSNSSILRKNVTCMEGKYNRATEDPHPSDTWRTNPTNEEFAFKYYEFCNGIKSGNRSKQDGAVVLDLFSGMSTFLVALKQVGIKMKKVIHVDHDNVALHVSKFNHENDGIQHVYIPKFEQISGQNLSSFLQEVGEIHIIVGGPPCQDYSAVNAAREGVDGENGKYLMMVANFIRMVQKRQKTPVWYVIENVVFKGDDYDQVCKAFGESTAMQIDSYHFSPCNRNRYYFVNFPVNIDYKEEFDLQAKCDDCLDDGFALIQTVARSYNTDENWSKANTFMASKSRLDDDRMLVVKKTSTDYLVRTFTVKEREKMLGLPEGYVTNALSSLFEALKPVTMKTNIYQELPNGELTWLTGLDERYHCFAGEKYNFKFYPETSYFELRLAPPVNGNAYPNQFYTEEEYGKRLIGNAVSVNVVAMLLEPLTGLFESGTYKGYPYVYGWLEQAADVSLAHAVPARAPLDSPSLSASDDDNDDTMGANDDDGDGDVDDEEQEDDDGDDDRETRVAMKARVTSNDARDDDDGPSYIVLQEKFDLQEYLRGPIVTFRDVYGDAAADTVLFDEDQLFYDV